MPASSSRLKVPEGAVLALLLVLAAGLRLFRLGGHSLWVDEILSIDRAQEILERGLDAHLFNAHGPLFFYLLAAIVPAQPSEFLVRLPSALFGVALVAVAYLLGRELIGRRAGLLAAALVALSPYALWYSQEARYGSLFMLLAAVSILFTRRFLEEGGGRAFALYVLSTLLMLFSFMGGVFLVLAQNLWALIVKPAGPIARRWILAQAIVGVVFIPWLVRAYEVDVNPFEDSEGEDFSIGALQAGYSRPTHPIQVGYVFFVFGAGYSLGPSTQDLHQDLSLGSVKKKVAEVALAGLLVGALAVAGFRHTWRLSRKRAALLALCLLCPVLGAFAMSSMSKIAYNVRYTSAAFPAFIVLLAAGAAWFSGRPRVGVPVLAGVAALFALSVVNYFADPDYSKEDSRGVARLVSELRGPGEPLVVGSAVGPFEHYYRGPFYRWDEVEVDPAAKGERISAPAGARGKLLDSQRVWLAATRTWARPGFRKLLKEMESCYPLERRWSVAGYVLSTYRTRPEGGSGSCTLRETPAAAASASSRARERDVQGVRVIR